MVTKDDGRQLAQEYGGIPFLEVSAKHNVNVARAFETLAQEACEMWIPSLSVSQAQMLGVNVPRG